MNKLIRNSLVLATLALGVVPSTGLAAPDKKNCDTADPLDRLLCRQGALAEQVDYTANVANGKFDGLECDRSIDAEDAETFEEARTGEREQ